MLRLHTTLSNHTHRSFLPVGLPYNTEESTPPYVDNTPPLLHDDEHAR